MAKGKIQLLRVPLAKIERPKVFHLKITLLQTHPVVWRTVLVHDFVELAELSDLIQLVMGWDGAHLYEFCFKEKKFGAPEFSEELGSDDAKGVTLKMALGSDSSFSYIYDMGDCWEHRIEVVETLEHDKRIDYPVCIGGENACPPEDCGGPAAYKELKKILSGKDSKKKDNALVFVGGYFNPTTFDPNFVNRHFLWAEPEDWEE
ncbi:MAG: plasmid pRiA4b ORF-3 family protein [Deltaproteobacteria bacterium]|jgi:hypothetical protein|nr:plasmid pRiA4b ORF-3 family protein [Deltaproteobacteria bacterium]